MMLVPYTRRNRDLNCYNPFRAFDDLERAFFSDRTPAEFRTDIRDEGDHYLLEADLPGFNKEDIHVDLDEGSLSITAAYKDGVLKLTLPKQAKPEPTTKRLLIE